MGRPLRQRDAGLFYHVMARGNNGQPLFLQAVDYHDFLVGLARCMGVFAIEVHCFTLMTNHLHLLLRPLTENLSEGMERLLGWYSRRFNWRYDRRGHLFQGRFLSKVVASVRYLKNLIAYFGNNPVKAGLCVSPDRYPYTSFGKYFDRRDPLLTVETVRALFPGGPGELRDFARSQLGVESDGSGWPAVPEWYADLGSSLTAPPPPLEVPADLIVRIVAESRSVDPRVLRDSAHSPRLGSLRALAAMALRDSTTLTLAEIAQATGYGSTTGVSRAISHARERNDPEAVRRLLERARALMTS